MSIFCNVCVAIDHCLQFKFIYSIEYFLQCFGNALIRWQFVIGQKEKRIYKCCKHFYSDEAKNIWRLDLCLTVPHQCR